MGGSNEEKLLKEILMAVRHCRGGLGEEREGVCTGYKRRCIRLKVAAAVGLKQCFDFNKSVLGRLGLLKV
jgi:hypothetical protein